MLNDPHFGLVYLSVCGVKMTKEVDNSLVPLEITKLPFYQHTWDDEEQKPKNQQFEDDCFIHIVRGKQRYSFFNGQDEEALGDEDVDKYAELVDNILADHEEDLRCGE